MYDKLSFFWWEDHWWILQSKWNTGHNISIFDTNVYNLITLDTKNSMILDIDQWLAKKVNQSITQKNNEKVKNMVKLNYRCYSYFIKALPTIANY